MSKECRIIKAKRLDPGQLTQLQRLRKRLKEHDGYAHKVDFALNPQERRGRLYPKRGASSVQGLKRDVRKALTHDSYTDMDMTNAHPCSHYFKRAPVGRKDMLPYIKATYHLCATVAEPIIALHFQARRALGKELAITLEERWGHSTQPRPEGKLVWIHAVSVGEGAAALPLISKILERAPETNILVTGGTLAAEEWRRYRYPGSVIRQSVPIDTRGAVQRFIAHWKPDIGVFIESELWPNLIDEAHKKGVRLFLFGARMSSKSANRWQWPVANAMLNDALSKFQIISPRDIEQCRRFEQLGVPSGTLGSPCDLKLIASVAASTTNAEPPTRLDSSYLCRVILLLRRRQFIWFAASTHDNEERACARIHSKLREEFSNLLTVIAPRHPVRSLRIRSEVAELGLRVRLLSRGELPLDNTDIYIIDVVGLMPEVFAVAKGKPAFIGGSLFRGNGHNVAEPSVAGSAVIVGPHHGTFEALVSALNAREMLCASVSSEHDLLSIVKRFLDRPEEAVSVGLAACKRVRSLVQDSVEILDSVLLPLVLSELSHHQVIDRKAS